MAYEHEEVTRTEENACLPLSFVADMAEHRYLRDMASAEPEEKQSLVGELARFLHGFLHQPRISGSADEWHNLSVDLAQSDLNDLACDVLERGLEFYPRNVDLLADYLQYGMECGRAERCGEVCKVLLKVPRVLWSWRGYRFLIGYYKNRMAAAGSGTELEKYRSTIDELLGQYRQRFPEDEGSYDCEAEICRELHDQAREEAVLTEAVHRLKVAPKCAMQLAMKLFERGEYEAALHMTQRALNNAMQTQMSVNEAYLHYLSGLSKMALLQLKDEGYPEDAVLSIYNDFETALRQSLNTAYRRTLKQRAIRLQTQSDVQVPPRCEELNYLLS